MAYPDRRSGGIVGALTIDYDMTMTAGYVKHGSGAFIQNTH